ncbi:PPR domain-containing protein/PPR_2 domain-containing protein/PPR_3 domain-containing protein/DYW_deaminase domain-containing protein [Cephalotus follicularis]|uniref:PPR domain-containing protein/PPR_2 domain-containing protein/PPR_3 domain-containing protein/DYW_deaminase domain-containing protein n=1 Tax=Cephalotus follicularis TaxID=3775 RepID=A0A1Q3CKQ0_CEPFO|nr:PPR domain-containing protein/PPR_2 domain-containing protein/PPR_3 domain-containing protein/DYW_deaminase domain-containing protein [Cephalotus follicularis]
MGLSEPPAADPRLVHAQAIKSSHRVRDRSLCNNLITLYSKSPKHHLLSYSLRIFNQITTPNIVSWTSLISAYSNSPLSLHHFVSMFRHPMLPNQRTLASLFKTCAALPHCLSFALALHALSIKLSLNTDPFSGSALTNLYCKYRLPQDARKVFGEILDRDKVCYAALIVGFVQNSWATDALSMFTDMICCNVRSTMYSVSGALRAAAELAAFEQCRIIHGHAVVAGFDRNVIVGSALVDGYGKAGLLVDARQVFNENLEAMNIVGWNALMAGYAQLGDKNSVLELFTCMNGRGFDPDEYSFLALLTAFYNTGSDVESERWFARMREDYGLAPGLEHYTCLLGAMGRAGRLQEAERVALTMPFEPDAAVWRTLLSICAYHKEADMALKMANRLLELDQQDDSAYVIVANVLSANGRWDEVAEVRKMMKERRVRKEGGRSWIEVKGKVHVFLSGDRRHDRMEEIYAKVKELMEEIEKLGYEPVGDQMLHNVRESEKREALRYHSEKLAVAFGLVSGAASPGKPLRIVKNLRICKDCHQAFKYISRVVEREIIVRDLNRYHRFSNGSCTCGDFW